LESGKVKGEMLYLEVYKNVIRDLDGNIIGVCGTGRDLTEYIEAVSEFEQNCNHCVVVASTAFAKYKFEG
jgi:flagellar biosynthesis/type III secretory pathway ATPase